MSASALKTTYLAIKQLGGKEQTTMFIRRVEGGTYTAQSLGAMAANILKAWTSGRAAPPFEVTTDDGTVATVAFHRVSVDEDDERVVAEGTRTDADGTVAPIIVTGTLRLPDE